MLERQEEAPRLFEHPRRLAGTERSRGLQEWFDEQPFHPSDEGDGSVRPGAEELRAHHVLAGIARGFERQPRRQRSELERQRRDLEGTAIDDSDWAPLDVETLVLRRHVTLLMG
jgi:hypothetical protein